MALARIASWLPFAERYFWTWSDFVFLGPKQFFARPKDKPPYLSPGIFLIITATIVGTVVPLVEGQRGSTREWLPTVLLTAIFLVVGNFPLVLLAKLFARAGRVTLSWRAILTAYCYASAISIILPVIVAAVGPAETLTGIWWVAAISFHVLYAVYFFAAVVRAGGIPLVPYIRSAAVTITPLAVAAAAIIIATKPHMVLPKPNYPFILNPGNENIIEIRNTTHCPTSTCWSDRTYGAPGDIVSVLMYYRNPSGTPGHDLRARLIIPEPPFSVARIRGAFTTHERPVATNGVVTFESREPVLLVLRDAVWYQGPPNVTRPLPLRQNARALTSPAGLRLGDIPSSGPECSGDIVVNYQVRRFN